MIKIGDIYVDRDHATDPWNTSRYRVTDIKGKWVRLEYDYGSGLRSFRSITKFDLWLIYKKIGHKGGQ